MSVLIVTSLGDVVVDLHTDQCPLTTKNFLKLCKIKYFNGCLFHTVQKDFTAQTGDPTGKGTGGDSIYKFLYGDQARFFGDEIHPSLRHSKIGTVSMASAGENLNASQFYFTLRDDLDYLDGKHTVFGEVAEGLDTLARINESFLDDKGRPLKNIRIKHTYILDDPFDDPSQLADLIPDASPEGKPQDEMIEDVRLEDDWVPMDETLGPAELEEAIRVKEAHSSAVVLETIGDIPDADIKPPENVLFVCKLNPVTEDEDLHTIFSRFGTVLSAEVIRDYKTGDSLCYAFIEFETEEACEQAYLKMDNTLIDDRRIHVDFSQSVSKLWSQFRLGKSGQMGKGKGCFKCGDTDHIARDCPGTTGDRNKDSSIKTKVPKYVLKDDNRQHSGADYDMVFEGDTSPIPDSKTDTYHKIKTNSYSVRRQRTDDRSSNDRRHREHERRDSPLQEKVEYNDGKSLEDRKGLDDQKHKDYDKRYPSIDRHRDYDRKRHEVERNHDYKAEMKFGKRKTEGRYIDKSNLDKISAKHRDSDKGDREKDRYRDSDRERQRNRDRERKHDDRDHRRRDDHDNGKRKVDTFLDTSDREQHRDKRR